MASSVERNTAKWQPVEFDKMSKHSIQSKRHGNVPSVYNYEPNHGVYLLKYRVTSSMVKQI